jgi:hypothetical protein
MIGVKPFCTGASTVFMGYELKRVSECFILHDMLVKLSFFFMVTVELVLESFDVLGHETNVSELGHRRSIFAKDVIKLFDRVMVENDVP